MGNSNKPPFPNPPRSTLLDRQIWTGRHYRKWDDYILDWMRLIIYILATLGAVTVCLSFLQTNLKLFGSLWNLIRYANGCDPKNGGMIEGTLRDVWVTIIIFIINIYSQQLKTNKCKRKNKAWQNPQKKMFIDWYPCQNWRIRNNSKRLNFNYLYVCLIIKEVKL